MDTRDNLFGFKTLKPYEEPSLVRMAELFANSEMELPQQTILYLVPPRLHHAERDCPAGLGGVGSPEESLSFTEEVNRQGVSDAHRHENKKGKRENEGKSQIIELSGLMRRMPMRNSCT